MKALVFLLVFAISSLPTVAQVGGLLDSMKANPNFLPGENLVHGDQFAKITDAFEARLIRAVRNTPEQGIELCKRIIALGKKQKVDIPLYLAFKVLIRHYRDTYKFIEAIELVKEGASIFSTFWKEGEARIYLEGTYMLTNVMSDFELSLEYSKKAERILRYIPEQPDRYLMAVSMIGTNYRGLGQYDSLIFYRLKSLKVAQDMKGRGAMRYATAVYLAEDYVTVGKLDLAIKVLDSLDVVHKGQSNALAQWVRGAVLVKKNKPTEALPYLDKVYKVLLPSGNKVFLENLINTLAECQGKLGNYQEAYILQVKLDSLKITSFKRRCKNKSAQTRLPIRNRT